MNIQINEAEIYSWNRLVVGNTTPLRRLSWRKPRCRRVFGVKGLKTCMYTYFTYI